VTPVQLSANLTSGREDPQDLAVAEGAGFAGVTCSDLYWGHPTVERLELKFGRATRGGVLDLASVNDDELNVEVLESREGGEIWVDLGETHGAWTMEPPALTAPPGTSPGRATESPQSPS
jgi:hypothetical protein